MKSKVPDYSSGPLASNEDLITEAMTVLNNNPAGSYKFITAVLTDTGERYLHLYRNGRSHNSVHSLALRNQTNANCSPAEYYWVAGPCQRRCYTCGGNHAYIRLFYRRLGYKTWTIYDSVPFKPNDYESILGAIAKDITTSLYLLGKGPRPEPAVTLGDCSSTDGHRAGPDAAV
jgi:hypothetical protein